MSEAHLDTQRSLAAALRKRGVSVELESWLPGLSGDRRIDVLAYPAAHPDRRVGIEVQQVDITVEAISARTASYQAQRVAPLWLRLLNFDRFDRVKRLAVSGEIWVERYVLRSWERWAHDQLNALWFCDAGTGCLWCGRFTNAFGWREGSEWYEEGGVYNSNPGGYSPVTRWVSLALEGPYPPEMLKVARGLGRAPSSGLWGWFVPPDGTPSPPALRRQIRSVLRNTYLIDTCELEQRIESKWIPAEAIDAPPGWRQPQPNDLR